MPLKVYPGMSRNRSTSPSGASRNGTKKVKQEPDEPEHAIRKVIRDDASDSSDAGTESDASKEAEGSGFLPLRYKDRLVLIQRPQSFVDCRSVALALFDKRPNSIPTQAAKVRLSFFFRGTTLVELTPSSWSAVGKDQEVVVGFIDDEESAPTAAKGSVKK